MKLSRIIREPLLHFLFLGAALFWLYAIVQRAPESTPDEVVVSAGQIEHLATTFSKTWQRPPTADELKGLVDQYVQEEILSREAIKLGLDRNDTVIRRRLKQKMEFLAEDFAVAVEPTEAELVAYLADHPDVFRRDRRFTFLHVYLNPEKRGHRLEADAGELLAELRRHGAEADVTEAGDRLMLPYAFIDESHSAVSAQFGEEFAVTLAGLEVGRWTGPVPSGYGQHLVLITDRTDGRDSQLDEVYDQVKRELLNARREDAHRRFLDTMLANYDVTIEWPKQNSGPLTLNTRE